DPLPDADGPVDGGGPGADPAVRRGGRPADPQEVPGPDPQGDPRGLPVVSGEQLADVAALRRVVDEYAIAVDRRDAVGFADLFTEDAVLAIYEFGDDGPALTYDGRDRLLEVVELVGAFAATMHVMANHVVDVDGDEASGLVY